MIAAGIGLRPSCSTADILAALHAAEAQCGRAATHLAAPHFRADAHALHAAAAATALPLLLIPSADIENAQPRCLTRSARVQAATGHASIAEACALAAAGPHAVLLAPRIAQGAATCALAGLPTS